MIPRAVRWPAAGTLLLCYPKISQRWPELEAVLVSLELAELAKLFLSLNTNCSSSCGCLA